MDIHGLYTEVLIRWMERITAGQPPLIFGDGAQTMDFVYTTDIARANLLAAASDVDEGVYNVASGVGDLAARAWPRPCCAAMGSDLGVEHGPERAVNGVTRRLASTEAAARDLGFTADDRARRRAAPAGRLVAGRAGSDAPTANRAGGCTA